MSSLDSLPTAIVWRIVDLTGCPITWARLSCVNRSLHSCLARYRYISYLFFFLLSSTMHVCYISRRVSFSRCSGTQDSGPAFSFSSFSVTSMHSPFCKTGMLPLLAQGPLRRVEHLHLSAWPPTLSFDLIALRFFHDLRTLVLAACHAVDSSVLHHLQECQSLRSIDISSCGALSETDIACLAALPSLEGIVLARNPHMFLKREQLRPLEALTALTRLDLGDTWLDVASYTDQGASFSASHPLLRHLCLANSLSDEGTAVAALLGTQLKHLADLSLRNARGMPDEALAAIARCSGLECLDVAGARFVTDDGIGALGQLKRLVVRK